MKAGTRTEVLSASHRGREKRQSSHLHLRVLINPPKNKMLGFLIELMFRLIISSADEQDKHGLNYSFSLTKTQFKSMTNINNSVAFTGRGI